MGCDKVNGLAAKRPQDVLTVFKSHPFLGTTEIMELQDGMGVPKFQIYRDDPIMQGKGSMRPPKHSVWGSTSAVSSLRGRFLAMWPPQSLARYLLALKIAIF